MIVAFTVGWNRATNVDLPHEARDQQEITEQGKMGFGHKGLVELNGA
jgi:hypothetical protein